MNTEKERQLFIDTLDKDLEIGGNHLIDDLPAKFTGSDFLYFFMLKDKFWAHVPQEEQRLMSSIAMTECYLSALLDIYSGDYLYNEDDHHLESCILYGDLLSGAFCDKLVTLDRIDVLERWLILLQGINQELLHFSREGKSTAEKKAYLIEQLVAFLATPEEKEKQIADALFLLADGEQIELPLNLAALFHSDVMMSADDFRALKG